MSRNCKQVEVPKLDLEYDPCSGVRIPTECMTIDVAFPELDTQEGENLTEIIIKMVRKIKDLELKNKFMEEKLDAVYRELNI